VKGIGVEEVNQSLKGSYILLIELLDEELIVVGSLKSVHFSNRYYAYVGSALKGLESRLNRHLSREKKLHWHIDYLLQRAFVIGIIICETENKIECAIARSLIHKFEVVPNFGSSDCRCPGHLFSSDTMMQSEILMSMKSLSLNVRVVC